MRRLLVVFTLIATLALMGCAAPNGGYQSPFTNTQTGTQLVQTSDGRWVPMQVSQSQDNTGAVMANIMGNLVGIGRDALNVGFATNWGRGYSRGRTYLHNMTYPTGMFNNNWGTNYGGYGYGGYGGYSYVPRGGIWVQ